MTINRSSILVTGAALACGLAIGFVDSRPAWDDTGITAAAIVLTAALLGAIRPSGAWLTGLAVGAPILLSARTGDLLYYCMPPLFGLLGALAGAFLRRRIFRTMPPEAR